MHASTDAARPVSRRVERRQATIAEIKALARSQLAENGPAALSLRGIARQMRIAPSALYRYYAGYDELIGALCVDAYNAVADAAATARDARPVDDHAGRWWAVSHAYRRWALENRSDFALIFGTPVPGFQAPPPVTGPAAARLVAVLLEVVGPAAEAGAIALDRSAVPESVEIGPLLRDLIKRAALDCPPRLAAIGLNAWVSLLGYLVAEIFGSLTLLVDDVDTQFDAHVRTVMLGMGFASELVEVVAAQGG